MTRQNNPVDRIRIASPCHVGWERMAGDERVRFCEQCSLHVYNISALTSEQVKSLIASTEGRICARLYRRADGTVLTRDCPVGLKALKRRVSKSAAAALTALLSLASGAFGQSKPQEDKTCERIVALEIKKTTVRDAEASFTGVIMDVTSAAVPGAEITLTNERTKKKLLMTTTDEGEFKFTNLAAGKYIFEIAAQGFKRYKQKHLLLNQHELSRASVTLLVDGETVTVGILVSEPEIESSNGTTIIRGEMLRRLPINQ
jgi:hypothetical protein